jgi:hypothetical protein
MHVTDDADDRSPRPAVGAAHAYLRADRVVGAEYFACRSL